MTCEARGWSARLGGLGSSMSAILSRILAEQKTLLKTAAKTTGLRYWMTRVLEECEHVAADFSADPVHDLRVALRRCRSMADGMMAMDPEPDWKTMKKSGKRLFQRLGALRDVQIMMEWIEKLETQVEHKEQALPSPPMAIGQGESSISTAGAIAGLDHSHDPAAQALLHILKARETDQKHEARAALAEFDRKQWRQWSKTLPVRASRIR